ncbi:Predicted hydrolase of the alpha/beta-hydrolase fold [Prochlorococcus marinus str. MIT 9515]|uniref:Predicted hydrolase of the alpha/beta-hydrolase fold n=1 Tax=Prochlorococcus marinus (strain MIT 9515) TaxID=167542 RepID=A2BXK5_PROM5|nr:alpha/beta fold hydrolase [Prochlorococcus marinus]ABM72516.1 Predicted hydrolase of the alpha/beta-hydrolase fold [Prochlorococcus marinus str. MIT 9515]
MNFSDYLKKYPFNEAFPWLGGDLQTLRDTFVFDVVQAKTNKKILLPINNILSEKFEGDYLLGLLELPEDFDYLRGIVIITHGLGGSTKRFGLKRIARKLVKNGFGVLKLNLRGAGSARYLAKGNYSARCSNDIISALNFFKRILNNELKDFFDNKEDIPIFGVGLSLGGTILLNACLDYRSTNSKKLIDGLACVSSPLDLISCSNCIERPRNLLYQKWLMQRLKKQLWDGYQNEGNLRSKSKLSKTIKGLKTIGEFDAKFTAPSWGFKSLEDYYYKASPIFRIKKLMGNLPPTLLIHARNDPWVPYKSTLNLKNSLDESLDKFNILITNKGGHNGFHSDYGCWSDEAVKNWLLSI